MQHKLLCEISFCSSLNGESCRGKEVATGRRGNREAKYCSRLWIRESKFLGKVLSLISQQTNEGARGLRNGLL